MEVEFDAKLTCGIIQDYMLHNGYNSIIWIVVTILGVLMMASFLLTGRIGTALIGLVIVLYMPVVTFMRAKKVAKKDRFQDRSFYLLNEKGITKVDGSDTKRIDWEDVEKASSTRKSILVTTTQQKTCIFPRKDMGDKTAAVVQMISTHIDPQKNKIRW